MRRVPRDRPEGATAEPMTDPGQKPRGMVLWLVGVPAAGKSTLAARVTDRLRQRGEVAVWLDSDRLRAVLTPEPTFTAEERDWFYSVLGHLAVEIDRAGGIAVVSATAPRRAHRQKVRDRIENFVEIYVRCDAQTVRARDPRGLYQKADQGLITNLPGAGGAFEPPTDPELTVDSAAHSPAEMVDIVLRWLDAQGDRPNRPG